MVIEDADRGSFWGDLYVERRHSGGFEVTSPQDEVAIERRRSPRPAKDA